MNVEDAARHRCQVALGTEARAALVASRLALMRRLEAGEAMYGINTGFGSPRGSGSGSRGASKRPAELVRLARRGRGRVPAARRRAGDHGRARRGLARGVSGVRPECVDAILGLLDHDIVPVVPSRGSVGASGDLAPLAHIALALIGEGRSSYAGVEGPTGKTMVACGLRPLVLEAKEGLALINGTHLMTAIAALALCDLDRVAAAAVATAALSIDACRATDAFLDPRLHEARRQPGQREVAARMRGLLEGSTILPAHREHDPRVQDPYCLRAAPQVIGAALDALAFTRDVVLRELGAVTDNPLVFAPVGGSPDEASAARHAGDACDVVSGGNFHGMPLAIALDVAKIALAHVAGISERRVNWLLAASDSENPVNAYLSPMPGLHSGLMIAQYAAAACCNELQTLAHPASVHNITTSAGVEDYNSFGPTSALHLRQSIELVANVVAIELLVMTEAMEYQRPLRSGPRLEGVVAAVRDVVPKLVADRPPAPDIAAIARLVTSGRIAAASGGSASA
ncbi:MAG: aromatic amino acid lyase [Phycisphaerales bacterium]